MMKLSFNKLTLTFIGLLAVFCTLCFAKAQAPRVRTPRTGTPRPAPKRPVVVKPVEKPPTIVANIGNYTITKQELEKRLMTEIRPNNYGNYNEEPEPVNVEKVLLKMIAEKAMISEARKGDYLKDESLSSLIKRYRDKQLWQLLLQNQLQPKLIVTEPEIQKRMKADPKLTRARAEATIKNLKARILFSQYYNHIYQKFHAKKLTEKFPKVVEIHQRLLTKPVKPRTGGFIRISQVKEELTPEEKNMVLVTFDKGKVTLKDWFDAICEMAPPSRPKDLGTVKGVEQLLDRALSKPLLLAEAMQLGLDKDKDLLQKVREYEDSRLLSKVRSDKYKEIKQPTTEEIPIYFGKNREVFRKDKKLNIDVIWCQDLKTARQAKAELDGGKDFEALKQKLSLVKTTKPRNTYPGGEGLFWKDLWKGDPNDVIGPIKGFNRSAVNWRIVKILEKNPGTLTEYSKDIESRVKDKMMSEQREAIFEQYGNELLKKYTYQIYADKIKDIDPLDIP
ncbi:MAG: peptidylprolyl isomerase [Planctomycetota bacterium]